MAKPNRQLRRLTASDSDANNAVNLLANRFAEYEKQKLGNLEDPSVLDIKLNQINNALLVIIDRLKASDQLLDDDKIENLYQKQQIYTNSFF